MASILTIDELQAAPLNEWRGEFALGGTAKQVAVGHNADGRLEIFYVGTNNFLYHNWQTAPNGLYWAGETAFAGDSAKQVVVARNADGRLEIFYVGTNNFLYHNWQTTPNGLSWAGETRLSNASALAVAVGQNADGRLEIFYVGTNNDLYHNRQTAPNGTSWTGEARLANASAKQVSVGRNADGRLEVFYVGTNNALYHTWQTAPNGSSWAAETRFPNDSGQQIAVGQNADGRLEIFYVGTNNFLYHNWQTAPNGSSWAGETRFPNDSAKQVSVGRHSDGRLEIFYVGTNNALYHNWQTTPNGSWAGETVFSGDSAQQIAVGQNADGRLEIFYVGANSDVYHNWQVASIATFGSNFNYILYSGCNPLLGLTVTINVTQDIVCAFASGPIKGFGFQLNAYSPMNQKSAWQQYVISLFGNTVIGAVDNWPISGPNIINDFFNMASLPSAKIPAGYQLKIALQNDAKNNVTGATYSVIDDRGKSLANVTKTLTSISGVTTDDVAPITAFELNLVGPVNSESAVLSSGAGSIVYQASTPLTALSSEPACTESGYITAETANSVYGTLPSGASNMLSQSFSIGSTETFLISKQGKVRPGLIIPAGQF